MARADLAHHHKGAEAKQQIILFIEASGFDPLPGVVRTYVPVGQTPIIREWWMRHHLSALSAIPPEGKLHFHSQGHALNSADVVGFLEHLLREVPRRMELIGDGTPIYRSHVINTFLAHGAATRIHLERLLCPGAESRRGTLAIAQ